MKAERPENGESDEHSDNGVANDVAGAASVGEASGDGGDEDSGGSYQPEESGGTRTVVIRRRFEQEDERGPEGGKGREEHGGDQRYLAQFGDLNDEPPDGMHEFGIGDVRVRVDGRQFPAQQSGENERERGGHPEHGAPTELLGDESAKRAREQDAEQNPTEHGADGFALLLRRGKF